MKRRHKKSKRIKAGKFRRPTFSREAAIGGMERMAKSSWKQYK